MKKLNLAVIGKDVSKSSSPAMHKFIAEHMGNSVSYANISVPVQEFDPEEMFEKYDGFNVTIPYKLSIIPYLNKLCGDAERSIPCLRRQEKGTTPTGWVLCLCSNSKGLKRKANAYFSSAREARAEASPKN